MARAHRFDNRYSPARTAVEYLSRPLVSAPDPERELLDERALIRMVATGSLLLEPCSIWYSTRARSEASACGGGERREFHALLTVGAPVTASTSYRHAFSPVGGAMDLPPTARTRPANELGPPPTLSSDQYVRSRRGLPELPGKL